MAEMLETGHAGGFILTEANGKRSRANVTVLTGQVLLAGAVLGASALGAAVGAAVAGNTGTGSVGAVVVTEGAVPGAYRLTIIEPGTNAGEYQVEDPNGVNIGNGTVGAAFAAGGIAFTLADGTVDFVAGDQFTVTVAEGTGTVRAFDPGDATGAGEAVGIVIYDVDATDGPVDVAAIVRDAEVNIHELVFADDVTDEQILDAVAQLATRGILAR